MTVAESVMCKVLALPTDKQAEVLTFVEQVELKSPARARTPRGAAAEFRFQISFDEMKQLRREIWGTSTDQELDRHEL
jgi:hypothetical protein